MWVRILDLVSGDEVTCLKGHHGPIHCARFSPSGESLSSGAGDSTIRIWPYKE